MRQRVWQRAGLPSFFLHSLRLRHDRAAEAAVEAVFPGNALGITKGALQLVIHVDANLQVYVCSVSRENRVGPVSQDAVAVTRACWCCCMSTTTTTTADSRRDSAGPSTAATERELFAVAMGHDWNSAAATV